MVREKKNAIIQQHEELWKSVSNQKILLRDKEDLLYRLEEISKDITTNRKPTHEDLEQWEYQLATINKALKIALERWENQFGTNNNDIQSASRNFSVNGRGSRVFRELSGIMSILYSYVLKNIILTVLAVAAVMVTWMVIYHYMLPLWICNNIPLATTLIPICKLPSDPAPSPIPENRLIKMPSVPTFVEKTTELAERLSNVDVSAPNKLTEVKISLIDLKARISYSNIEQPTRQILTGKIGELKTSVESTTDNIHEMLAGFGGTLSKLETYTRYALTYLTAESSTLTSSSSSSSNTGLVIGNFEEKIQSQFQHYVEQIEKEINRIIHIAEDVHSQLLDLDTKYETVNDILSETYDTIELKLKIIEQKILNEGYLVKLYRSTIGNGESDKAKHQHNLGVLKEFKDIVKLGIIDVNNVIDRLKRFKAEAAELKSTVTEVELAQAMSLNVHMDILKSGIERLNNLKQRLDGRMKHKQIHQLDHDKDDL